MVPCNESVVKNACDKAPLTKNVIPSSTCSICQKRCRIIPDIHTTCAIAGVTSVILVFNVQSDSHVKPGALYGRPKASPRASIHSCFPEGGSNVKQIRNISNFEVLCAQVAVKCRTSRSLLHMRRVSMSIDDMIFNHSFWTLFQLSS